MSVNRALWPRIGLRVQWSKEVEKGTGSKEHDREEQEGVGRVFGNQLTEKDTKICD